jgi:hypothetical protein
LLSNPRKSTGNPGGRFRSAKTTHCPSLTSGLMAQMHPMFPWSTSDILPDGPGILQSQPACNPRSTNPPQLPFETSGVVIYGAPCRPGHCLPAQTTPSSQDGMGCRDGGSEESLGTDSHQLSVDRRGVWDLPFPPTTAANAIAISHFACFTTDLWNGYNPERQLFPRFISTRRGAKNFASIPS